MTTELSNQIRGIMKTFGLVVPAGKGSVIEKNDRNLLSSHHDLAHVVLPLLDAWKGLRARAEDLGRKLVADARQSQACRILMSISGVGAITATSFATAIEEPGNFRKSRSVGAWIGLTTRRRYRSGEVDYDGNISRRGDRHLRGLLYEEASVILTRSSKQRLVTNMGASAAREDRLQKGCRDCRAKAGCHHAHHAENRRVLQSDCGRGGIESDRLNN
jgi:transposase